MPLLPLKKQGRPLLLERIDGVLQEYIKKIREHGAPITTAVVIASARGIDVNWLVCDLTIDFLVFRCRFVTCNGQKSTTTVRRSCNT